MEKAAEDTPEFVFLNLEGRGVDGKQAEQGTMCETSFEPTMAKTDSYKILTAIKADCEKITVELMGSDGIQGGAASRSTGPVEKATVRELLEQICKEVNRLSLDMKGSNAIGMHNYFPVAEELPPKIEFGAEECNGDEIRSETDNDEQVYLLQVIASMIEATSQLSKGASIDGSTTASILQSMTHSHGLVVKLGNYLDVDLDRLEYIMSAGSSLDLPQAIKAMTVEALRFSAPNFIDGQFSYRIPKADLRIVASFAQRTNYLAIALAPAELPTGKSTFVFEGANNNSNLWGTMMDKTFFTWSQGDGTEGVEVVLQNRDIMVGVKFVGGEKASIEINVLQVISDNLGKELPPLFHKPKGLVTVVDGKTLLKKMIPGILEYVLENYGYVMEIVNLLQVSLNEPVCYLENGEQPLVKPEMVSVGSREVLVVKMDKSGKGRGGCVTFRIGTTDLRIAIVFQLFNNGNRFGAAFLPSDILTDASLMLYLTSDDQWSTSPDQKFGMAKDGDFVIQTRNVRARVAMTRGLKAVLRLVIKTF